MTIYQFRFLLLAQQWAYTTQWYIFKGDQASNVNESIVNQKPRMQLKSPLQSQCQNWQKTKEIKYLDCFCSCGCFIRKETVLFELKIGGILELVWRPLRMFVLYSGEAPGGHLQSNQANQLLSVSKRSNNYNMVSEEFV